MIRLTRQYNTTQNKGDNKSDWTYTKDITLKLDTCVVTSVTIQDKVLVYWNTMPSHLMCSTPRIKMVLTPLCDCSGPPGAVPTSAIHTCSVARPGILAAVDGSLKSRGPEVDFPITSTPITPIQVGNRIVTPQIFSGYQSKAHNYLWTMYY